MIEPLLAKTLKLGQKETAPISWRMRSPGACDTPGRGFPPARSRERTKYSPPPPPLPKSIGSDETD